MKTKLSEPALHVLSVLRQNAEGGSTERAGVTFRDVYLPNVGCAGFDRHTFAGLVSALESAGLYRPTGADFGEVAL